MSANEGPFSHVSDTALMVAAARANETERPDGLVRDPFAARLAGERGFAFAHGRDGFELMSFVIGMRSQFLDELLLPAIAAHAIETVVNIGCGLDTRPWRLTLPPALRWIEADFPEMLAYKDTVLAAEPLACRLERIEADVNDAAQRQRIFDAIGHAPALMITEGLLTYLPGSTVEAISAESAQSAGIRFWVQDIVSPALSERGNNCGLFQAIRDVRAPDAMNGDQIVEAVTRHGWRMHGHRGYIRDAIRIAGWRVLAMQKNARAANREATPVSPTDTSGVYLFSR